LKSDLISARRWHSHRVFLNQRESRRRYFTKLPGMLAATEGAISTGADTVKTHREARRSAAIVAERVGISLTGRTIEVLADCSTEFQRGCRPMKRWIARLALAEAMTMTSGVFLFGTILLGIAALLTCNLLDELAAQPQQTPAPVKAEA
jgi:hypothetical protein